MNHLRDIIDALRIAESKDSAFVERGLSGELYIFDMPIAQLTSGQQNIMKRCGWLYDDKGNWSYDS